MDNKGLISLHASKNSGKLNCYPQNTIAGVDAGNLRSDSDLRGQKCGTFRIAKYTVVGCKRDVRCLVVG